MNKRPINYVALEWEREHEEEDLAPLPAPDLYEAPQRLMPAIDEPRPTRARKGHTSGVCSKCGCVTDTKKRYYCKFCWADICRERYRNKKAR